MATIRLTLRTLLAYLDDTLGAEDTRTIGEKLAASPQAQEMAERLKKVVRKRSLSTPGSGPDGGMADPNIVAAYLSDALPAEIVEQFEKSATDSDAHLAEVAACHQILTLVLSHQQRVPPTAYRRMYGLVKGPESIPTRKPNPALPIGGTPPETAQDADEADAAYLLGLPPYGKSTRGPLRLLPIAAAVLCALGFGVSAFMCQKTPPVAEAVALVQRAPAVPVPVPAPGGPVEPRPEQPVEQKPTPAPEEKPKPALEPIPDTTPVAPQPVNVAQPPKAERFAIGKSDTADKSVLMALDKRSGEVIRELKGSEVFSTDRLTCLPGYRAVVKLNTGVVVEAFANVSPEQQPLPFLETAFTLNDTYDKQAADITLHAGRLYLNTAQPTGSTVRIRFAEEVWDMTLPDANAEVMVEVQKLPARGAVPTAPLTRTLAIATKGTCKLLTTDRKELTIPALQLVQYVGMTDQTTGPTKPDAAYGPKLEYVLKEPKFADAKAAALITDVLEKFAMRINGGSTVKNAIAELRTEPTGPATAAYLAGARYSVLATGALGEVAELADCLNDGLRGDLNAFGLFALRNMLATTPDLEETFEKLARGKLRIPEAGYPLFRHTIHGLTEAELQDDALVDRIVEQLAAPEVAQRGAAYFVLLSQVDTKAAGRPGLLVDLSATAGVRELHVRNWMKHLADLRRK